MAKLTINGIALRPGQQLLITAGRNLGKTTLTQNGVYTVVTGDGIKKKRTNKNCRPANKPIYSNKQMKDCQHHIWSRLFPHAVELKASSWRKGPTKKVLDWLEQNVSKEDYRIDIDNSRYIYFKNESDRNLIILTLNDIFQSENPLHHHRSKPTRLP